MVIKIRQEQIEAFIEAFVSDGLARAKRYQVYSEAAVETFVRIQLSLGAGFDTDPRYPWAAEILRSDTAVDAVKMWLLSRSAERLRVEARPEA